MVDSAAVISLCTEQDLKRQAEYTFAMGRHALADTSAIFRMKPSTPREDRLPRDQFLELRKCIGGTGTPLASHRLDEEELRELRKMYEPQAEALSAYFLMALPSWLPTERSRENWKVRRPGRDIPFAVSDPFSKSDL